MKAEELRDQVMSTIAGIRLVSDRVNELRKKGYVVVERSMGSGGVGQIKVLKNEIRIQIGYGHGKHNYAMCVIFNA